MQTKFALFVLGFIVFNVGIIQGKKWDFFVRTIPPPPRFSDNPQLHKYEDYQFDTWTPELGTNLWEYSGLWEGDIMTYDDSHRNGLLNETYRWPNASVPFYIDEHDFDINQTAIILNAFEEYHNRTCVRFRPYTADDKNWIVIKGNYSGCWSSVGMRSEGQVVNLSAPKCVQHGVVMHELLHALGFYHQQSSHDRDEYVRILWHNILDGREYNFNKYNDSYVTNYDTDYDYSSVMHYSSKAFSKNGKVTIEPLESGVTLGQRLGLSDTDVIKLNKMYASNCNKDIKEEEDFSIEKFIKEFLEFIEISIEEIFS